MIEGLGIDILAKDRLLTVKNREDFEKNIFTRKEIASTPNLLRRIHVQALYFSVKEAVLKALGCGLRFGSFWRDIEIDSISRIRIAGNVRDFAVKKSVKKIHTAAARTRQYALSVVLLESEDKSQEVF
ncbi:MAG: 4'-phosphopantetheinyl transferase superfamily protein [candidate division WOR-3 bacterium]|nr:MAG: 4'-phosphopantetheinyl transferase superfamily protein [candidate division WOR-3 bacterium]